MYLSIVYRLRNAILYVAHSVYHVSNYKYANFKLNNNVTQSKLMYILQLTQHIFALHFSRVYSVFDELFINCDTKYFN